MSIKIDNLYATYLSKKYGDLHPLEDAYVFNSNGSLRAELMTFSIPGGSLNLGGAWYGGWSKEVITDDTDGTITTIGSSEGFIDVTTYFDADKTNSATFNFWNSETKTYQPVELSIEKRDELIGYRYFEIDPGLGPGYYGDSVSAHDLKFYGADKNWAYIVTQGEASYPEEEGRWGDLPKTLTYYVTDSPFVSYIDDSITTDEALKNLRIVPMISSFVKNVDGKWVGKLGFGVYRNTYGVKTWARYTSAFKDYEVKSVICPDENGPFGNWLIDIGSPYLSKEFQWFEGEYAVNLNRNITIS